MNIEDIKKRANTSALNQAAWTENYRPDVKYLLSIIEQQSKVLELIANGNNDFPTWSDAVDVLIDVRVVAKETLQAIGGN